MKSIRSSLMVLLTATWFASSNLALPTLAESLDKALDISILLERDGEEDFKNLNELPSKIRGNCDLKKAVLPVGSGPTFLSSPAPLMLKLVLLGHGTQNYTCADSTAASKPVPNGAKAVLFDASCFAVEAPSLLHKMPLNILTGMHNPPGALFPEVGSHYFHPDASTPVFVVDGEALPSKKRGKFVGKKAESVPAPPGSPIGLLPDAFGAVDWLKLINKVEAGTSAPPELVSVGYKAVYRVETAGGKPPATCDGRPAQVTIPYATEYWLFD